ncbi:MAG: hypothetical protein U0518_00825 [Candidatus Gracilibacteria bacterium]
MKQNLRKYIFPLIMTLSIGGGALAFASFSNDYLLTPGDFPTVQPSGEKSGGVFRDNFDRFFRECGSGSISLGYDPNTKSQNCITMDELRDLFALQAQSQTNAQKCDEGSLLVGFTSTGGKKCQKLQ